MAKLRFGPPGGFPGGPGGPPPGPGWGRPGGDCCGGPGCCLPFLLSPMLLLTAPVKVARAARSEATRGDAARDDAARSDRARSDRVPRSDSTRSGAAGAMHRAVRCYQAELTAYTPACPHTPGCSEYAAQAIERHGAARGAWLTARRLLRCRPGTRGGADPVP